MILNSRSKSIDKIVSELLGGSGSLAINEAAAANMTSEHYQQSYAGEVKALFESCFGANFNETNAAADTLLSEDASAVAQQFINGMREMTSSLNENATISTAMLASTIATTIRQPIEASIHRLYKTETVSDPAFMIHEKVPTVKAPNGTEMSIFDAFDKGSAFIDGTEIKIATLATDGVANGAKNSNLLTGMDSVYKISKDLRIAGVKITDVLAANIRLQKGSSPYFDTKTNTCSAVFEVLVAGVVNRTVEVMAKVDFARGVLESVFAPTEVTHILLDAKVSHEEHTHPIETGLKTKTATYTVPTRPHIEISVPEEVKQDMAAANSPIKGIDLVTTLTDQALVISAGMEDLRLIKNLNIGAAPYEAEFDFEAPLNFANGNIKNFQQEFFPLLDQIAAKMKTDYHIFDCHFKVGVSPFLMTLIEPDYTITKSAAETGDTSMAYQIAIKTSASVFELVATERLEPQQVRVNMILNKAVDAEVRTFHYMKYSSFLTDKLRKASNNALPAIVYSERNLEMTFTDISADLTVKNLAVQADKTGNFIKRR